MPSFRFPVVSSLRRWMVCASVGILAACGGGADGPGPSGLSCSAPDQKLWLRDFMAEWYFWSATSPVVDPATHTDLVSYFDALLTKRSSPGFPADRWSYFETTQSFNQFYGEGRSLGYGMFVAGLEVTGLPDEALYVRYVEPQSDAAFRGVRRGDRVLTINGRPVRDLIAANDFAALTPAREGEVLTLTLEGPAGARGLSLVASAYPLTPVGAPTIVSTAGGRRVGYVMIKDMVEQANAPLDGAFAQFKALGVHDVVIDLRYNGGGLVSVAASLGAYVNGPSTGGRTFASLLYNEHRAASNNQTYAFAKPASALGLRRVYILAGPRTCSASELVINGLRPFVEVVTIGDTTCGKPVGFLPASNCGNTFNAVNFETVNADLAGRYFDGLDAVCPVSEDFSIALGSIHEPLLRTALSHVDQGHCPSQPVARMRPLSQRQPGLRSAEPGERQDMVPR